MKKDFLDELMEELQKLKDAQKKVTISAPVAPHKVISTFTRVAKNHELTYEEKRAFVEAAMSLDGITPQEAEILQELDQMKNGETE